MRCSTDNLIFYRTFLTHLKHENSFFYLPCWGNTAKAWRKLNISIHHVCQPLYYVAAWISQLLLNVIDLTQVLSSVKDTLQTTCHVVIPSGLGCHAESNQASAFVGKTLSVTACMWICRTPLTDDLAYTVLALVLTEPRNESQLVQLLVLPKVWLGQVSL